MWLARRRILLTTTLVAAFLPSTAAAETRARLDASLGATAASNPYLLDREDAEAVGADLTLRPQVTLSEDDTIVTLNGQITLETFFDDQELNDTVQVGASVEHRANERTTVSANVGFRTSESAARRFFGGTDLSELDPGEFPSDPILDPTLGIATGRATRLDAQFAVRRLVSTNGVLDLTAGAGLTRVESANGNDFRDTKLAGSYARTLDERTALRVTIDGGYVDYLDRRAGDGYFLTALAGADYQFSESMYGSVQLGVSYSAIDTVGTGRRKLTDWSATFDLCDMLARGTLCVTASRSAQPTSFAGITTVSAIGINYQRVIGADGNVSLAANYSRSDTPSTSFLVLRGPRSEIANAAATYSHRLNHRLSAFVTPSFTGHGSEFAGWVENYQVVVGVTYHFGPQQ